MSWEPVDAKPARQEAKPGTCCRCASTPTRSRRGRAGARSACTCGSARGRSRRCGSRTSLRTGGCAVGSGPSWTLRSGALRPRRAVLEEAGVGTLAALADRHAPVDEVPAPRQERLVRQAGLQRQARDQDGEHPPSCSSSRGRTWSGVMGSSCCRSPTTATSFSTSRGTRSGADAGLFFLFGLIAQDAEGVWEYRAWWAHDRDQEAQAAGDLIAYLTATGTAPGDARLPLQPHGAVLPGASPPSTAWARSGSPRWSRPARSSTSLCTDVRRLRATRTGCSTDSQQEVETSTQAITPPRSRPALLIARSSSSRSATVVSSHSRYWWRT